MDDRFVLPEGELIRRLRQGKFWSQEKLADEAGLRKRTIERAEAGERFQRSTLSAIAHALGLPLGSIGGRGWSAWTQTGGESPEKAGRTLAAG
jgi:transcriptional regulator with XRE-family HTH domain